MKPQFDLISKSIGTRFVEYKGNAVRLTAQTPAKVDEVILGIKGNHNLTRKITTFRDSKGEIIERSFDYFDKPYRNRVYSSDAHIILNDEFVNSTSTTDYLLDRDALPYYKDLIQMPKVKRTILWSPVYTVTNHVAENEKTGEIVHSQVKIGPAKKRSQKVHTFIEYPHIKNHKVKKSKPKFLSFRVKTKDNTVIKNSIQALGVNTPHNDIFLGYRALSKENAIEPTTNFFIKENKLDNANITVNKAYNPLNEKNSGFSAIFNAEEGVVNFNKDYTFKSKSHVVKTAAHEAEHARQFFLQGLLKGGDTPWQTDMAKKFGPIKDPEIKKEAKIYDEAIEDYVPFWQDKEAYSNNIIEKLANQKGILAQNAYDFLGLTIRSDFRHIPKELL